MIRGRLKAGIETGLLWSGAANVGRARHRHRALVLVYHNIVPDGVAFSGETSLHLTRSLFAAHLDALVRTHDIVPLDSLLEDHAVSSSRPRVVITFDDAYRGAVTLGVEELARRRLPGTVFVTPAFVGGASFWWDCLSDPDYGGVRPDVREHALAVLRGEDAAVRAWAMRSGPRANAPPDYSLVASETELAAAARHAGITFGSHTWSHPNLTALEPLEVWRELELPLGWLRDRFDNVISWLSYPYGLTSHTVGRAAADIGYRGAFRVNGGWMPKNITETFNLPRFNVPAGLSVRGFCLRSAGLFCS